MTATRKDKGRHSANCATQKENNQKPKISTKLQRIIDILKARPEGLNRFEAEAYGEHCLNSTAAVIRDMYGTRLVQRWEIVPTRYCSAGVRVLRYWIVGGAK